MPQIKLGLVDDHDLIRKTLASSLSHKGYDVVFDTSSGNEALKLLVDNPVDVVIMDLNMEGMNGAEATKKIKDSYPEIKVVALSASIGDYNIIRMLKAGARAYVSKNSEPEELYAAIDNVHHRGIHFSETVSGHVLDILYADATETSDFLNFKERELKFLELLSTELTYKEIANEMCVSPRTVEGYRNDLCDRLNLKSRVGLVLFAIRNKMIE